MRAPSSLARAAVVACTLMTPSSAGACGGFFCANQAIAQAGEQIAFVYEPDGSVTTVVQVQYSGPSEEFAWILPVPERPTVALGTSAFFTQLWNATVPIYRSVRRTDGECSAGGGACFGVWGNPRCSSGMICLGSDEQGSFIQEGAGSDSEPEVRVETSNVGPFEVAVLETRDGDGLRAWLLDNGYVLPDGIAAELDHYVEREHFFIALRLRKDRSTGEIAPIVIRSSNTEPCVPIRLTSVAATDDMPVTVYVLADRRARPFDWLLLGESDLDDVRLWRTARLYPQVVSEIVDAAGGHAFVTDFSGAPPDFTIESDVTVEHIAIIWEPVDLVGLLFRSDIWIDVVPILVRHFPVPEEFRSPSDFFGCVVRDCGGAREALEAIVFAPASIAADIEAEVLAPRREAQAMVDSHAHLTRLFTTLSPDEMTRDPTFVLSDELPPIVDRTRTATLVTECSELYVASLAPQILETPSGRRLPIREGTPCSEVGGGGLCAASAGRGSGAAVVIAALFLSLFVRRRVE